MEDKLNILWTTGDPITSEKMVLMYSTNCRLKNWWKEVEVMIWGASASLIMQNELIQEKMKMAMHTGVTFVACKGCTDQLNISGELEALGVDVRYIGGNLTEILKEDGKLLTV